MKTFRSKARLLSVIISLAITAQGAFATDLITVLNAAQTHDLDFLAAQSTHMAGLTKHDQANAMWRPDISVQGGAGRMNQQTQTAGAQFVQNGTVGIANFNTSINQGTYNMWAVSIRQPIINGERSSQSQALHIEANTAELEWQAAQQDFILRTIKKYFDVSMALETVKTTQEQLQAVQKVQGEAQARYKLGDAPILDVHETTARLDGLKAQLLAVQTDLDIKESALSDATGINIEQLKIMIPSAGEIVFDKKPLDFWLSQVNTSNPQLLVALNQLSEARQNVKRYHALSSPSLDLVGQINDTHVYGSGDYGPNASNLNRDAMVGVQLTIPLYNGGMRIAKEDEAAHLADVTLDRTNRLRQQIGLQTKQAYLGLTAGVNRVEALKAAWQASEARRKATQLGKKVGDRTTLDLLNAETDAANAHLNWIQSRVDLIINELNLAALSGQLTEDRIKEINSTLQPF
ncbi:TolC family protein [Ferrovum sp. PN-J185]|uniref:TolC family protein n=1 Tax=Ferrovum sp. PN-J185 TaxID=1356306 RepID=UPI00079130D6|nr:TolC family protein [Ferrovum sp. PN-J185]KXW55332.1 outer membrane protein TolC precursor [Ferrovum sp. PN-J185]MCC6068486.1 TolC family protein [Ferrovum sp. PN-J185]MDE2056885.1 TolC family protein [Betaproteobacteria bacterium]